MEKTFSNQRENPDVKAAQNEKSQNQPEQIPEALT